MDIQAKELIDKKNQFDNEFYKPELEKIDQEIEKQYAKLEEPLQKKEDLISDYGMHEEAALDELSYSERNAIYDAESKINNLDRLKQDLKSRYDSFIPGAKNE